MTPFPYLDYNRAWIESYEETPRGLDLGGHHHRAGRSGHFYGSDRLCFGRESLRPGRFRASLGYPSRDPGLDALPGFINPPPGYGAVAFYWWLGDPLTKERLRWQLDKLRGTAVVGLQVNYAHAAKGNRWYGPTLPSEPPLFSEAWWDLFGWFMREAQKQGLAVSLSDYTLCVPGQGWWNDEIIAEDPALRASVLRHAARDVRGPADLSWDLRDLPGDPVESRRLPSGK